MKRDRDIALICNPAAGGRWRELAAILDSSEARMVRRIVTDELGDIELALADLGQSARLICIYGGDGTIQRIVTEMLRRGGIPSAAIAFIGGGTMNIASRWCGWSPAPAENFRAAVQRHLSDHQLYVEAPLLDVRQGERREYGFTFGAGPVIRVLDRYERSRKGKLAALGFTARTISAGFLKRPRSFAGLLDNMPAEIEVDGQRLPYDNWSIFFANSTGQIHLAVRPFNHPRTRETFHAAAYSTNIREIGVLLPFLAMGKLPIDPAVLLRPASASTQLALSYFGKGTLPLDPRYINRAVSQLTLRTREPIYTIDGEIFESSGDPIEVRLGPALRLVAGPGKVS